MNFKISEISRMIGLSVSGIRYYEKAGVISPLRGENGKYREFSLHELQLLLMCKYYRQCGFSIQESIDLLKQSDSSKVKLKMKTRCNQLEQEITRQQMMLELMKEKTRGLDCLEGPLSCITEVRSPALLRLKLWRPGMEEHEYAPFSQIMEWFSYNPFIDSCLILPEERLLHGSGLLETEWGLSIEESFANRLGIIPNKQVERIPSCDCVRLMVRVNEDLTIDADQLSPARQYLADHDLTIVGDAISRMLLHTSAGEKLIRYD